jgi:alkanesulfonate monooxygenase SsuD/methylene tetrahydromethanopterin reductase-like flavin-dependent oxidoreductase (luciferase family)
VASPNFRHPAHFAREITALDDISGGRLTVGIGSGGIVGYDNEVLGQPLPTPRTRRERFEEFVGLLDRILVSDGGVTSSGKHYAVTDARSIPGCVQRPRVPFVIAATGPRAMRLAAQYGAGWVTTGLRSDDVESWWRTVAQMADQFGDALAAADRDPATMDRYLLLDPACPVYSLSSAGYFADAVERATTYGFTDVVTYWPRESGWFAGDEAVLEAVAADVLPHLTP